MHYISLVQVVVLHRRIIEQSGGTPRILYLEALESALQQPLDSRLFATILIDGNKRTGHAAMEVFLVLNGHELWASVDDAEEIILRVASGKIGREQFADWIEAHLHPLK